MTALDFPDRPAVRLDGGILLESAARFWFIAAVIGQWAFFYYIFAFYGRSAITGGWQAWTKNPFVHLSYVPGDVAGNIVFATHVSFAAVIAFGGALQLIPWLRQHSMQMHRWNGRLFVITAVGASLSGLYIEWVRSGYLLECLHGKASPIGGIPITVNALLTIAFVGLAWRAARAHRILPHRRWAMRAYLVANGQWFFRVGLFAWMTLMRGPVGVGKNFDGPFVFYYGFGCYLLPLLILELYLRAKSSSNHLQKLATASVLAAATLVMMLGIFGVAMLMWLPSLGKV